MRPRTMALEGWLAPKAGPNSRKEGGQEKGQSMKRRRPEAKAKYYRRVKVTLSMMRREGEKDKMGVSHKGKVESTAKATRNEAKR